MRILLVHPGPEFSVQDVFTGWEKALKKQGHQVMSYNMNHRLSFYGNAHLKDYPEGWEGTRQLPACPACGQEPFKKAMTDDQVKQRGVRSIFEDCFTFWPEVVFFVSGFFFDEATLQVMRARNMKLVCLHTESPYEDDRQMKTGAHMDLNLINDPTRLAEWRTAGSAYYMPHAYDPDIHFPEEPFYVTVNANGDTARMYRRYESDFTFVGTGFKSRRDFFGQMDLSTLNWSIGGGGWGDAMDEPENAHLLSNLGHHPEMCVDNVETAHQYRIARTGLNLYRKEGESGTAYKGWSMGPRELEMAACGLFFIRDPRPEGDELFKGILPTFRSPEHAAELLRYWSHPKRDDEREKRAAQARARIADRTFDSNARKFMEHLDDAGLTA